MDTSEPTRRPTAESSVEAATPHAVETYLPRPPENRSGTALCLSGGGFRAALFHLGALRRLNELGILSRIDTITSVSGGSIIAAHLASYLVSSPLVGDRIPDWERGVAAPFRAFTARNLRTIPLLIGFLPWNLLRNPSAAAEALAKRYRQRLTKLKLTELPERPSFVICATDMVYGSNWEFKRTTVGDYQAGYAAPPPDWPVARAVAASSCFPPVFNPLPVDLPGTALVGGLAAQDPKRVGDIAGLSLTDGGVYDNLGLEPVWKDHATVLVSDGGAPFAHGTAFSLLQRVPRYAEIVGHQASSVRKRWLISSFINGQLAGAYWGISSAVEHYGELGTGGSAPRASAYGQRLVDDIISKVRTDLDAFSEAERNVLENHGYLLADAAIRRHVPSLGATGDTALVVPHPEWLDEARVRHALAHSHERSSLGRF